MMGPPTGAIGGPPTAAPAMPAKSLFADILKFRKPDSEEVATTGTTAAAAEDKENFRAASVNEGELMLSLLQN
jgi:hypothetical protein